VKLEFPAGTPLTAFSAVDLDAIFNACTTVGAAPNEVIFNAGDSGDCMYFVLEGEAVARLHDGRTVKTYGRGTYFGELSFINPGHKRSATLVATKPMKLLALHQSIIPSLITTHPVAVCTLLQHTCAFLVDAERMLVADLRRQNAELQETIRRLDLTRTQLSEEEEKARTDSLSGLSNRRAFDAELPRFIERAQAINSGLALIAIDLDHFKPVNDKLGHPAGDFVLREVGKILRSGVRKSDLPCRIGGDEFVVILSDTTEEGARARAESLRQAIGSFPHPGNEQGIRVTTTMGGTLLRPTESLADFVKRADEALYEAKRGGRNRVGWV
jgi:diguanylate cyclase (GGDEF)-like protein